MLSVRVHRTSIQNFYLWNIFFVNEIISELRIDIIRALALKKISGSHPIVLGGFRSGALLTVLAFRVNGAVACIAFGPDEQEQIFARGVLVDLVNELACR